LNLAQAVQIVAWELRAAWLSRVAGSLDARIAERADAAQMEQFFAHLAGTLDAIDFHKGRSPVTVLRRLRRIFLRAEPSPRELRALRGGIADAERMARMAGMRSDTPRREAPDEA